LCEPRGSLRTLFCPTALVLFLVLSLARPSLAQIPISFGQTIAESITTQGEKDTFIFMGAIGDIILVRVTTETELWPQIDLYDPEGSLQDSALEVGPGIVEIKSSPLTAQGYHQIKISDYGNTRTGAYWIFVQRLNDPGMAVPLDFGKTLSASITKACEEHTYYFDALAGDIVQVRVTTTSGLDPAFQAYSPEGDFVTENFNPGPVVLEEDIQMTATGRYLLLFKDDIDAMTGTEYGTETGDYWIFVQRLNNPGLAGQMDFGELRSDAITSSCDIHTYVFDALQDDVVWVRLSTEPTIDPAFRLRAPDGSYVTEDFGTGPLDDWITLPDTGAYTLMVQDWAYTGNADYGTDTGGYRLFLQRLNNPGLAVRADFGKTRSASISTAYELDTYAFSALQGDTVIVRVGTDTEVDPEFVIWGPSGEYIDSTIAYGPDTEALVEEMPATGSYTLTVVDNANTIMDSKDHGQETGNYWIFVQRLNNPGEAVQLGFGQTFPASISSAFEVDTYRFDALQDDVVEVTMSTDTGLDPALFLHAPDGAFLDGDETTGPGTVMIDSDPLGATGTFTVLAASGGSGKETGTYRVSLSLKAGDPGSMTVSPVEGLHASGLVGGPFRPLNRAYTLHNSGSLPIQWTATKNRDWVELSAEAGTLEPGASFMVTVSINPERVGNFPVGTYTDTITVTNVTEANRNFIRLVSLRVDPIEGILTVTPQEDLGFSGPPGGPFEPSDVTYTVTNVGEKSMNWRATKTAYWLSLSRDHGALAPSDSADVVLTLTDIAPALFEGVHTETLSFTNQSNGYGNTSREIILAIGVSPSKIRAQISTDHIILGEPLYVSGKITPEPCDAGAWVDVVLIPPSGPAVHQSVIANALGEFDYSVACGDIKQHGTWSVQTSWGGDRCLGAATSAPQSLEVTKAESRVTVDAGSRAVKLGDLVDMSGKFTPDPDCGADLTGREVRLFMFGPEGRSDMKSVWTNDRFGHFVLHDYNGFNALGQWSVQALFLGDGAYEESHSEVMTVQVVETAGYAVVVEGRIESGEGLASHNKTAHFVYEQLKLRGLLDEDIYYLNYDESQVGVDGVPSGAAVHQAVTEWARDKMNTTPANLYIVFVDHGFDGRFYAYPDEISSGDLGVWLDTLQNELRGQAAVQEIVILLGFCRSGSFLNDLSGWRRVVMASAAAKESSYKGPLDPEDASGVRDGEFFITEFFKAASVGKDVLTCFNDAAYKTELFTSTGTGSSNAPYGDDSRQHPLLEDNGDGLGDNSPSGDPGYDGYLSRGLFIGVSTVTGNAPGDVQVIGVSPTQFLGAAEGSTSFWAQLDNNNRMRSLWLEVKAPGYQPGAGGTEQIEMDLPRDAYDVYDQGANRYVWNAVSGFSEPGTYQVFFFARDDVTGNESSLKQSLVYKAKAPNSPPGAFDLVSPSDGAQTRTVLLLDWSDSADPNGDPLTYTVEISEVSDFATVVHRAERLAESHHFVGKETELNDLKTYYWRVKAVDYFGASTMSTQAWQFDTNNTNIMMGWIRGHVYNAFTGQSITAASVTVGVSAFDTALDGYYLAQIPPGTYAVDATASGYVSKSFAGVVIPEGNLVTKDFGLYPLSLMKGDVDGNLSVNLADAVLAMGVLAGIENIQSVNQEGDVNSDGKIGIEEVIYILQDVCELR
jgi:hypothetical protein